MGRSESKKSKFILTPSSLRGGKTCAGQSKGGAGRGKIAIPTVGPIFNEKIAESEVCVSCKQYARPACVAKKWLKSQIVWL